MNGLPERTQVERFIEAPETRYVLEKKMVANVTKSETTPSVKNVEYWRARNTGAVTVTNFIDGQEGQHLYLVGDGQTTLQHGSDIETQSGSNLLLALNKAYHFIYLKDTSDVLKWRQI